VVSEATGPASQSVRKLESMDLSHVGLSEMNLVPEASGQSRHRVWKWNWGWRYGRVQWVALPSAQGKAPEESSQ
jgi:hypothetical protein